MSKYFVCNGKGSGEGNGGNVPYGSFELLGNLHLSYDYGADSNTIVPQQYIRQLSLNEATATTQFTIDKTDYTRTYFTSFEDDVLVIRLSASDLHKINFSLTCSRPEKFETTASGNELQMKGQLNNGIDGKGMQYLVHLAIKAEGGTISHSDNMLQLKNANTAVIYVSAGTSYNNTNHTATTTAALRKALKREFIIQHSQHKNKFQSLFNKVTLQLGSNAKEPF
jgi:alpha-L-fucosidase 2